MLGAVGILATPVLASQTIGASPNPAMGRARTASLVDLLGPLAATAATLVLAMRAARANPGRPLADKVVDKLVGRHPLAGPVCQAKAPLLGVVALARVTAKAVLQVAAALATVTAKAVLQAPKLVRSARAALAQDPRQTLGVQRHRARRQHRPGPTPLAHPMAARALQLVPQILSEEVAARQAALLVARAATPSVAKALEEDLVARAATPDIALEAKALEEEEPLVHLQAEVAMAAHLEGKA